MYIFRKLINKFGDFDKYGRPLGTIYKDETTINKLLVSHGYAKEYFGGTK